MTLRATIVGAGVAGLCVAAELSARNVEVTVLDRAEHPGPHGCSWWAGGMLAPFCEGETAEEPVVRLGQEAAGWWERQGVEGTRNGSLVVALGRDRRELDRFARRTEGHRTLGRDELAELEPQLEGRFDRALHFPDEAHLSPRDALGHLREALEARGVRFVSPENRPQGSACPVEGREAPILGDGSGAARAVGPDGGAERPGHWTFDCRGLAARDVLPDLRGVKGEMAVLRAPDVELHRPVRLLHPRYPLYIVPRGDGVFMLGATQIESGERGRATVRSVLELLSAAYALHPAFGEAELLEVGVDARPAFPDNLPRLRRRGDTIHVNGLFRHGFLLAPALARMAAEYVCDGKTPEVMDENHG
ncbi:FAD-dependent oxidoreductase [Tranquillimonas alkanivorans]|uniref:Glycine oxidase n=1 Tax=Tranquillimonas alkanivorans TaxID=441119 RepID=A0A1I5L350_9RHOB|nr:FAD-dependent oxidoreductase [Tranquillimonas alkanivorans]SFO91744.1 glycine oxidase [Tranquillimonas alkanivorans]